MAKTNNKSKRSTAPKNSTKKVEPVVETNEVKEEPAVEEKPETKIGTISNCKKVYLRETPAKEDNVLGILEEGTDVVIIDSKDGWTEVTVGTENGYIMSDYVEVK